MESLNILTYLAAWFNILRRRHHTQALVSIDS